MNQLDGYDVEDLRVGMSTSKKSKIERRQKSRKW